MAASDARPRGRRPPALVASAIAVSLLVIAAGVGFATLNSGVGGTPASTPTPEPTLAIRILLGETPYIVHSEEITFEEVVSLSWPDDSTPHPDTRFTVSYRRGPEQNPTGTLGPGGSVKVRNGMRFDIAAVL